MKIIITDDRLEDEGIGHNIPIGTICEGWYEDDQFVYVEASNKKGSVVLLLGEYEILEE